MYELDYLMKNPKEAIKQARTVYARSKKYTILDETFIGQSYYPLVKNLKKETVIIDIGSNIGDTAIYFAQFDKVKKVMAFEQNKLLFIEGRNNIIKSPFINKIITFGECNRVQLQNLIKNTKEPIAIKCDIEGNEKELFEGLQLPKNVYAVIMELHDTQKEINSYFKEQCFKVNYKFTNKGVIFKELGIGLYTRK
jgi:hypothetical protein